MVDFTDEEGYGRYLDLHDCFLKYINLKGAEVRILSYLPPPSTCVKYSVFNPPSVPSQKLDYITYLTSFDQLFDISKDRKNAEYKRFVYLVYKIRFNNV